MLIGKGQRIKQILPFVVRMAAVVSLVFCLLPSAQGQSLLSEGLTITHHSPHQMCIEYRLNSIKAMPNGEGESILSTPAANSQSHNPGQALLPEHRQLVALTGNIVSIDITQQEWDTVSLDAIGICRPLSPYRGARAKDTELATIVTDSLYYATDTLWGGPLISLNPLGSMRGTELATLVLSPVRYNPRGCFVALCRSMKATITFASRGETKGHAYNPMLATLPVAIPQNAKDYNNALTGAMPQVLVAVSASKYRETLQPLLSWKRQEGYIVEEVYFDYDFVPVNDVKSVLQERYDNATEERPAPLFIMIVGDFDDIAMWTPRHNIAGLEGHRTDFYYSEFTGDMMPDALIGRLSVRDTVQLRHVVEKTLAYEQGLTPDTLSSRRSLLVAGMEETFPAPTVTNGQVNYLKNLLIAHDSIHDTICFYNPESAERRDEIIDVLRQGVGLVNYTSHCNSVGWRNPTITGSNLASDSIVDNHLFLAINNCCRSNDVPGECFGEQLLRFPNGGAVGAIGASNETLWVEDYYWSVGCGTITEEPLADSTGAGALDRLLHRGLMAESEQAWTQSQIVLSGNSSVAASGSPYADFYWEIYSLLGDPTLMPRIGPIKEISLECDSIRQGDTMIVLRGTPRSRVALTYDDTLMALCTLGDSGEAVMRPSRPATGTVRLTATKQFHKPCQLTFTLIDTSGIVSIHPTPSADNLHVYPNPTGGTVTVKGISGNTLMTVYDIEGHKILERLVGDGQSIQLKAGLTDGGGGVRQGVYVLKFSGLDDGIIRYKKIVIK